MEYKTPKQVVLSLLNEEKETLEIARLNRKKLLARLTEEVLNNPRVNQKESIKGVEKAIVDKTKEICIINKAIKLIKEKL